MAKTKSLYLINQRLDSIASEDGRIFNTGNRKWNIWWEKRRQLNTPDILSPCAAADNAALNRVFRPRDNETIVLWKRSQGDYVIVIDRLPYFDNSLATLVPRAHYLSLVRRQRQAEVADAMHALQRYCDFDLTSEDALKLNRKATMLLGRFLPSDSPSDSPSDDGTARQQEPEDPSDVLDYPALTTAYPAYAVALGLINP